MIRFFRSSFIWWFSLIKKRKVNWQFIFSKLNTSQSTQFWNKQLCVFYEPVITSYFAQTKTGEDVVRIGYCLWNWITSDNWCVTNLLIVSLLPNNKLNLLFVIISWSYLNSDNWWLSCAITVITDGCHIKFQYCFQGNNITSYLGWITCD